MYDSKLYLKYYKSILYSNFININFKWAFRNINSFNKVFVSLYWHPKKYNRKSFIVSILLVEYLLKGPCIDTDHSSNLNIFLKSLVSKKFISISYVINAKYFFFFFDLFIIDICKNNLQEYERPLYFKINLAKNYVFSHRINNFIGLIDNFIKKKAKFENYILKKKVWLSIYFFGLNFIQYIWLSRAIGFSKLLPYYN